MRGNAHALWLTILLFLALIFSQPASAQEVSSPVSRNEHSALSLGLLIGAETTLAIDMLQTLDIQRLGQIENNFILGRHPSDMAITGYFAAEMVGTYLEWRYLPDGWREAVLGAVIGIETYAIVHNASYKVGIAIPFVF